MRTLLLGLAILMASVVAAATTQFEITIASPLRDMEASYATVQRLMK
jgi:hypothetical protein